MTPEQFFKCLADETRCRCLLLIQQELELCVCELMAALDESQPKISRHLAQLRKCGLLEDRRQGQWVFYRVSPELPAWMVSVLQQTLTSNADYLQTNLTRLQAMGDRPERVNACCA
ncbi:metalloregulator ArsR/SmtB family transcription factor [Reinekea blandensis]|uniref:Transcriptional Regulator, ArsR family protein n=1 Tax=Reinekea blandensis MED297 TaxID=314283 RepID=A4BJ43_9GAMM|nr:metalloregulator ArsR/SmtB family transcription factor [Reinekea blandensis]EAR07888.1 Transcriptional Regulator, ArsR family protein [Reinekea sp. MED297] [Reinekea blandensis MED297]